MRVTATHSKRIEVELDDSTVKQIVIGEFRNIFDLPETAYIKDDKVMISKEYYTSHSWYEEEIVREATEEDKIAIQVLRKLQKEL